MHATSIDLSPDAGSIPALLGELRALEAARVAAERQDLLAAEAARREQRARDEARQRAEQAAQRAAALEAVIARAQAREMAERDARTRLEADVAAELARMTIALETERQAGEQALARAERARVRPRWMLAVTTAAALVALSAVAVGRSYVRDVDAHLREVNRFDGRTAEAARAIAVHERELASLDAGSQRAAGRLDGAARTLEAAERAAATALANRRLAEQRRIEAERARKQAAAAAERARRERTQVFDISEACKNNAVCR